MTITQSWINNTLQGGGNYGFTGSVQQMAQDMCYVPYVSGPYLATNAYWCEGHNPASMYSVANGVPFGVLPIASADATGGCAICTDGTYIYANIWTFYFAQPGFPTYSNFVARLNLDGSVAPFSGGVGPTGNWLLINSGNGRLPIFGLSASATQLFVADPNTGTVITYNTATMTEVSSFTYLAVRRIAYDALTDSLWVSTGQAETTDSLAHFPEMLYAGTVERVSFAGAALAGPVLGIGSPKGLRVVQGALFVCDDGPDQNIKIVNPQGQIIGTIGTTGGYLGGSPGVIQPHKLHHPTAVDFDPEYNVYVLCDDSDPVQLDYARNSALSIAAYSAAPNYQQIWAKYCAGSWDDVAMEDRADPGHVYTVTAHIDTKNWTTAPGVKPYAWTTDPFTYPLDPRYFMFFPIVQAIWWIGGIKYMSIIDQYSRNAAVYAFMAGSEIATPSAIFGTNMTYPGAKPPGWIWTQASGIVSASTLSYANLSFRLASDGGMWSAPNGFITHFLPTFSNGLIAYSPSSYEGWVKPSLFTAVQDCYYDPASDTLWVSGWTAAAPQFSGEDTAKSRGSVLAKYSGWRSGSQTLVYSINLPHSAPTVFVSAWDVLPGADAVLAVIEETQGQPPLPPGPRHSGYLYIDGTFVTELAPSGTAIGWTDQVNGCHLSGTASLLRAFMEQQISANTTIMEIALP